MKIAVCSVFRMAGVVGAWQPDAMVSALPPSFTSVPLRDGIHRLRLTFHDIEVAIAGRQYGPSARHLRSFVESIAMHRPERLLVVCAAGLSRSPALAIVRP